MEFTYILYMGEAIALTVMLGVIAIPLARKYKAQQSIREEGPKSHRLKAGTPTMGGAICVLVCSSCRYLEQIGRPISTLAPVSDFGTWLAWFFRRLDKSGKEKEFGVNR